MGSSASKKQEYDETMWAHGGPSAPDPTVTFSEKIVEINGHARNVAKWIPAASKKPKGLVVIAHGLHEHCLRYHGLAHALVQKGYAVHAVDHCAHGLSAGGDTKGLVEDYRVMVNDFVSFSRNAQEEVPAVPCYLFAHSMGTLIATLALRQLQPTIKAAVFSGCPIFPGYASSSPFGVRALYPLTQTGVAIYLAQLLASMDPKGPAAPILFEGLFSDEESKQRLLKDRRRVEGEVMNKTAFEVLKMVAEVKQAVPDIQLPFLAVHGQEDTVALPESSAHLLARSSTPAELKRAVVYPGLKHELFHEAPEHRVKCIGEVVTYIEEQHAK